MAMNDKQAKAYLDGLCTALGGASHDLAARRADGRGNGYVEITLPDGTAFSVQWGGYAYKDRIRIGTSYPSHKSSDGYMHNTIQRDFDRSLGYNEQSFDGITIAETKTPEQAAKDIERRFLPAYRPLYVMAVKWAAETFKNFDKRISTKERANAAKKTVGHHMHLRNVYEESVNVEMSISIDDFERLCAFLAADKAEDKA